MKVLITGHTRGIGKHIYDALSVQHTVDGISTSTGHDISTQYNTILNMAKNYDLFINNACVGDCQSSFLRDLCGSVPHIVTIGSTAGYYHYIETRKKSYCNLKYKLIALNRKLAYISTSKLLLLNVGLTENASPEPGCTYKDIIDAIEFWLVHTNIIQLDFGIRLTNTNIKLIESDFNFSISNYSDEFF